MCRVGQYGDHVEVECGSEVALRGVEEGGAEAQEGEDPNQGAGSLLREGERVPEERIQGGPSGWTDGLG